MKFQALSVREEIVNSLPVLKRVFIYLWSGWCWLALGTVLFLAYPVVFLMVFSGSRTLYLRAIRLQRSVAKLMNLLFGIRLIVLGEEKPDFTEQAIYISNHNSNLDPFITGALVEADYKFIGKAEVLKMPVFGFVLRHLNVPVRRDDPNDRARSMADLAEALNQGFSLIIYPEGTRNRGGSLAGNFHEGAFRLSLEYGVPIRILAAINSDKRIPPTRWLLSPGRLYCRWSKAHLARPGENKEAYALRCREEMIRILREGREELEIETKQ